MINADNISKYVSGLEAKVYRLEQAQNGSIPVDRFYATKMDIPEVARLHGVDPRTVRGYVKLGLIDKHPDSTDSHTYIRGSVALSIDFKKLRKNAAR